MNVAIGTEAVQFPEKELHKWDFPCSVNEILKYSSHVSTLLSENGNYLIWTDRKDSKNGLSKKYQLAMLYVTYKR